MQKSKSYLTPAWFVLIVLGITGAWWTRSGYVFLLDSVWGPRQPIDWSTAGTNLGWQVIAHFLAAVLGGPITEKLILSFVLWSIGIGGWYLAKRLVGRPYALAAGTLYLLNPFVYERLLGGQWIVLAGYALMPVVLATAYDVLESSGRHRAFLLIFLLAINPFVSPHFAYIDSWLLVMLLAAYVLIRRPRWLWSRRVAWWSVGTLVAWFGLNAYWLWHGSDQVYKTFTSLDFSTFRTATDPVVGVWGNVLGLYGFWRGPAFIEPKQFLGPVWMVIAIAIIALAATGAVQAWRKRSPMGITLCFAAPIALVLGVGYTSPLIRPFVLELANIIPGFRGLRETGKFIGVLALAYALLGAWGAETLALHLPWPRMNRYLVTSALCLLAVTSVAGIWNGFSQQAPVASYPSDWSTTERILSRHSAATVVILPWHEYESLDFADNAYVAQPSTVFFSGHLLTSDELDNILVARPDNTADRLMLKVINGQISAGQWLTGLRNLHASYIVLEKTDDASVYEGLLKDANLHPIFDGPQIALYRL